MAEETAVRPDFSAPAAERLPRGFWGYAREPVERLLNEAEWLLSEASAEASKLRAALAATEAELQQLRDAVAPIAAETETEPMAKRQQVVLESLHTAAEQAAQAAGEAEATLEDARVRAKEIIEGAEQAAKHAAEALLDDARAQARRILDHAEQERALIEQQTAHLRAAAKDTRDEISALLTENPRELLELEQHEASMAGSSSPSTTVSPTSPTSARGS